MDTNKPNRRVARVIWQYYAQPTGTLVRQELSPTALRTVMRALGFSRRKIRREFRTLFRYGCPRKSRGTKFLPQFEGE